MPFKSFTLDQLTLQDWLQLFHALPDHVCLLDLSGSIVVANRTMRERFEPIHGDLTGLDYRLIYCGTSHPDPQPPCASVLSTGLPVCVETTLATMKGIYLVSSYPVFDSEQKQWGAISIVRDVTMGKQIEAALKQANELLEQRVAERTRELERVNADLMEKVADLEKFEEVVVGRELRMIQLQRDIERLTQQVNACRCNAPTTTA